MQAVNDLPKLKSSRWDVSGRNGYLIFRAAIIANRLRDRPLKSGARYCRAIIAFACAFPSSSLS